jgi:cobalt-precorrin-5B (C1)-methyltransferase
MRTGYTTGSCAAAAAKAATLTLLTGVLYEKITIHLPIGQDATLSVHRTDNSESGRVTCSVLKDGGDDPDATHGAEICATVSQSGAAGDVVLKGGSGVGTVTLPGTGIAVGEPSITRVPRAMIVRSVNEAAESVPGGSDTGYVVEISVPGGEEIAKNTDNGRLGILGGISILGTTGVVQPFSTAAWRASVNVSIDVASANELKRMVITTGTQSENFAKRYLSEPDMAYVNVGIFTGPALKRCVLRGIPRATLVGMVGKFSKIAMGKFVTHVAGNKVDPVYLTSLAEQCGASEIVLQQMREAASGRHFQEIALEHGVTGVFDLMCEKVCEACEIFLGNNAAKLIVDSICFDFDGAILGKATTASEPLVLKNPSKANADG